MKREEYEEELAMRSLELNDGQREKLDELIALYRRYDLCLYGHAPSFGEAFERKSALSDVLSCMADGYTLDVALKHLIWRWNIIVRQEEKRAQSEDDGGEGDVPTRNPSPEAAPDEEPETLVAVRDASGVVREVTLDEAEEMREAAQGIYEGRPPEPLLIEDRTDAYFRLLGIADWPETPCTGDYGLSDCLAEPSEETLDFVDAFFAHEDAS